MVLRLALTAAFAACHIGLVDGPKVSAAQPASDPSQQPGRPSGPETLEQSAARVLARVALTDLRIVGTPSESDYRIAAALLEHAHALVPGDDLVLRQLIECQENAGDTERVNELTRTLIKLDPADTVAQLRLISASVRRLQNADDRLAVYDRWLGKEGASVDPSVLSRLALDAALLAREKGDVQGFVRRLTRAVELDSTNKDAATLALTYYTQRVSDPVGQFELMLAVLNADPLDADLHQAIGRHLAAHGAYPGAARFFNTFGALVNARGEQPPIDDVSEIELVRWRIEGPRPLIERYDQTLFESRQAARRQREQAEKNNAPLDTVSSPDAYRLPMSAEWVRFLAALSLRDPQLLDNAFDELIETARQESERLSSADTRPQDISDEEATNQIRGLLGETTCARLLADKQSEKIIEGLDILRADPAFEKSKLAVLEALNLGRNGDFAAADELLKPLRDVDPLAALAWCVILERRAAGATGEQARSDAVEALTALAAREAATLPGAYAASRVQVMTGKRLPADETARKLDALAAGVPGWLETMISNTRRFQNFEATLLDNDVKALDPVRIRITLRNVSPVPLGVGPDGPINSRVLIAPQVQVGTDSVPTGSMINVVSLERRLRLPARSEFSATVLADSATLSFLLEQVSGRLSRVRYRLLQGFEAISPTMFDAGPHCLVAECGPVRRSVLGKSSADVPALVRFAETGSARDVAEAVLVARGRMLQLVGLTPLTSEELGQVFAAVARRLPELSTPGQLLVLSNMPVQGQHKEVAPVDDAARLLTDPAVRSLFLAVRARTADDPVFAEVAGQTDSPLARLAELAQDRLRAGTPSLATYVSDPQRSEPGRDAGGSAVQPDK